MESKSSVPTHWATKSKHYINFRSMVSSHLGSFDETKDKIADSKQQHLKNVVFTCYKMHSTKRNEAAIPQSALASSSSLAAAEAILCF